MLQIVKVARGFLRNTLESWDSVRFIWIVVGVILLWPAYCIWLGRAFGNASICMAKRAETQVKIQRD